MQGLNSTAHRALLAGFARKYMWWPPIGGGEHTPERIIAQVMNLGTYDDLRRLESALGPILLGDIARRAAPGWLAPRAWEFWRGRLSAAGISIPATPPCRTFDAPDP